MGILLSRRVVFVRVAWLLLCVCVAISTDAATLSGTFTPVVEGTTVDLTTAGMEWEQWGTEEGVNRKTEATPSIGDLTAFGFNSIQSVSNFPVLFNWNDGVPLAVGSN